MIGRSSCLHAGTGPVSILVCAVDEWCPPCVITWSLILFSGVPPKGCGIQHTPGDTTVSDGRETK